MKPALTGSCTIAPGAGDERPRSYGGGGISVGAALLGERINSPSEGSCPWPVVSGASLDRPVSDHPAEAAETSGEDVCVLDGHVDSPFETFPPSVELPGNRGASFGIASSGTDSAGDCSIGPGYGLEAAGGQGSLSTGAPPRACTSWIASACRAVEGRQGASLGMTSSGRDSEGCCSIGMEWCR